MKTDLAYLAGAMDADGHFTMLRRTVRGSTTYSESCGLTQLSPVVPNMLKSLFGGHIQLRKRNGPAASNWRPLYCWAAANLKAIAAVRALRPYLRIKAEQADILIALRKSKNLPTSKRRTIRVGVRCVANNPEVTAERESLYARIKSLNHNGVE
jgi:hypothetical protein